VQSPVGCFPSSVYFYGIAVKYLMSNNYFKYFTSKAGKVDLLIVELMKVTKSIIFENEQFNSLIWRSYLHAVEIQSRKQSRAEKGKGANIMSIEMTYLYSKICCTPLLNC